MSRERRERTAEHAWQASHGDLVSRRTSGLTGRTRGTNRRVRKGPSKQAFELGMAFDHAMTRSLEHIRDAGRKHHLIAEALLAKNTNNRTLIDSAGPLREKS